MVSIFADEAEKQLTIGKRAHMGLKAGAAGMFLDLPFAAIQVANAKRGEVVPLVGSKAIGYATFPLINAAIFVGLTVLAPGIGTGVAAELISMLGAGAITAGVESKAFSGIRAFSRLDKQLRHVEMGGSYVDSETAYNLRMRAISEMGACMQPSRRYLGQEALILHR